MAKEKRTFVKKEEPVQKRYKKPTLQRVDLKVTQVGFMQSTTYFDEP